MHVFAHWCYHTFQADPRFALHLATNVYDATAAGKSLPDLDNSGGPLSNPPTFDGAFILYASASLHAETSVGPEPEDGYTFHLPISYLWETANALCASGGKHGRGVELGKVRGLLPSTTLLRPRLPERWLTATP